MTPEDRRFLGLAFDLARRGLGATSPNPLVGAVVVLKGAVVGTGYHARAGGEHAETVALREAGSRARGGDLYLSLEPCCQHRLLQGRTPPCVEQIIAAGVRRVVAAARDPNPLISGRGLRRLEEAGVDVEREDPFFAEQASRLNEIFFKFVTTGTPFVALKAGMSLDGKIALPSGASRWVTCEDARSEARSLRRLYDSVLIGVGTALADDPLLLPAPVPGGPIGGPGEGRSAPTRVVLDSMLRTSPSSRLAKTATERPVIVYASREASMELQRSLEDRGVIVVRCGSGRVSIGSALADLAAREVTSVLVEGGGEVLGAFLRGGFADKVHLFMACRVLGGRESVPAFGGDAPPSLDDAIELERVAIRSVGAALLVEGYPRSRASRPSQHGSAS